MAIKVTFKKGTWEQYNALETKDQSTIYWLTDRQEVYVGDKLYGTGLAATQSLAGLMSADDKKNLDELVNHGVAISGKENNLLEMATQDQGGAGLYAALTIKETDDGTYSLVHIKADGTEEPIGTAINIRKAFKSGSIKTVEEADDPYQGAKVGDKYLDIVFDDVEQEENKEQHLYIPVNELVDQVEAGNGIEVDGSKVSIKINADPTAANGLEATKDGLGLTLATQNSSGAMSNIDKQFIDSVPTVYDTVKYEFVESSMLEGSRVTYRDDEVRVMFASDTEWKDQHSGAGADEDAYYMGLRIFAPGDKNDKIKGLKRGSDKEVSGNYIECIVGGDPAGIDKHGRKFYLVWLPVARKDKESGSWNYLGAGSSEGHFAGWYITIEWYNNDPASGGKVISSETIRVNLSNEKCHNSTLPYYSNQMSMSWEEMGDQ